MHVALGLAPLALAFFDSVGSGANDRTPLLGFLPCLFERNVRIRTKAHLMASGKERVAEHPLRATIAAHVEPKSTTVRILAFRLGLEFRRAQSVKRPYHLYPRFYPLQYMGYDGT